MIILISIATLVFTFLGGLFALRFKDKLHLIFGFSAGAVLGVAFFDLLPEALEIGKNYYRLSTLTTVIAAAFLVYLILDRVASRCAADNVECANPRHRGRLGAGSLGVHSFLDGLIIGFSFQVSTAIGLAVATAVLVHDFSDGINTVNLILIHQGSKKEALRWLVIDALAPVLGVLSTLLFTLPKAGLGLILAIFCGFFLYIGASELLPESHHRHPTTWTTVMTLLGVFVLYLAIKLAGV